MPKELFFFFKRIQDLLGSLVETKLVSKSLGQRKGRARAFLFLNVNKVLVLLVRVPETRGKKSGHTGRSHELGLSAWLTASLTF